jgi:2-succinyl-6-hydroxy-2,4-cyclohexadiene-1-carboxylate synthase
VKNSLRSDFDLPTEVLEFNLGGANYNVVTAGAGAPLMLLHGFTGCAESWAHVHPALVARFKLIMPDLPGHGRTDSPTDPARYRMERCVEDLIAILDALGLARTHLLGYSMGGRVALAAATEYPSRIASLILESASPGLATAAERQARVASDNALADFIEHEGVEAFVARWERIPLFSTQERLPQAVRARIRQQRLLGNSTGLANSLRGLGTGVQSALWERLGELRMRCLIMAGELDTKFVDIARRMAAAIGGSRLAVVAGAGHTVHLEQQEAFERLVMGFAGSADSIDLE